MWATQNERDDYFRQVVAPDCPRCGANPCYFICENSPHYYSPEREREDALFNDSLPYDAWFREAVAQYERVHGEPNASEQVLQAGGETPYGEAYAGDFVS